MSHITHTVSTETALHLVANQHRRSVLDKLIESERNSVAIDALIEHMSPEILPESTEAIPSDRLRLDLYHNHLPKLEDAGLVEYDNRTETVHYHPNDRVEKLHQFVTTELE
ncbi:DUF7344 domain-containing protein [Natronosalvus caseinilyticus]|uniref:DUF7344 domain-containing protein n=1 Tax=Natronosalvus caseinilyticus TaxID=2953747 RepID=UPI0028B057B9|nr:ArsR family transcriptional regulator [Natronosalvus caseinilyticus]